MSAYVAGKLVEATKVQSCAHVPSLKHTWARRRHVLSHAHLPKGRQSSTWYVCTHLSTSGCILKTYSSMQIFMQIHCGNEIFLPLDIRQGVPLRFVRLIYDPTPGDTHSTSSTSNLQSLTQLINKPVDQCTHYSVFSWHQGATNTTHDDECHLGYKALAHDTCNIAPCRPRWGKKVRSLKCWLLCGNTKELPFTSLICLCLYVCAFLPSHN